MTDAAQPRRSRTAGRPRSATPSREAASPPPAPLARPTPEPASFAPVGRIPVIEVSPVIEDGRWPAKGTEGEAFPVRATVFREGHDAAAATAHLIDPDGREHSWTRMVDIAPGLDRLEGWLVPDRPGDWSFRIDAWGDPYATWRHEAEIKIRAGIDIDLVLEEGARLLERAGRAIRHGDSLTPTGHREAAQILDDVAAALRDPARHPSERLALGTEGTVAEVLRCHPLREHLSSSATYPLTVDRERALFSAWYEMFPRSEGARYDEESGTWRSGTLRTAAERLPAIAGMGFDTVYLTPIHPIGTTNRKGRNNTLVAEDGDPGSPYGIGSADGGHDAIHPELGDESDFAYFVDQAREHGLEVALDLALQASPDHPWVTEHPEWFTTRADGTIAYAENPPKKYQDIYPLNFDNDPEGIYQAVKAVVECWIGRGVTAFRVDNPHTKPMDFWHRLLAEIRRSNPEVLFLSEAFTRPARMRTLGAVGFHQSYTYFTWRHTKEELGDYFTEVARETDSHLRPSFWPTTHDILTPYMQQGGRTAFAIRAVLAATGSPTWGIYSGYELAEHIARPGAEEQIDNEKYEYKPRDWAQAESLGIAALLTSLNGIRRAHPALQRLRDLTVHPTSDDATLAFSKRVRAEHSPTGREDTVIIVVTLDPYTTREGVVHLDLEALGVTVPADYDGHSPVIEVVDELDGQHYSWGAVPFVRLSPARVAHILHVRGTR